MHLVIESPVTANLETVWAGFTKDLFLALAPPEMGVELVRFDGCDVNDEVHLNLRLPVIGLRQDWVSVITDQFVGEDEIYFVDEGRKLPFFLSYWKHRHIMRKAPDGGTLIIDDIDYKAKVPGTGPLLYPQMYMQFKARRPIYQKIFGAPTG